MQSVCSDKTLTLSNVPLHRRAITRALCKCLTKMSVTKKITSMTRYLPGSRAIFVNSSPSSANDGRQSASTSQPVHITKTAIIFYSYPDNISVTANAHIHTLLHLHIYMAITVHN